MTEYNVGYVDEYGAILSCDVDEISGEKPDEIAKFVFRVFPNAVAAIIVDTDHHVYTIHAGDV